MVGFFMPKIRPVSQALILINVLVFGLQWLTEGPRAGVVTQLFALWPLQSARFGWPDFHLWQLLTCGFLHASGSHLFFNMFGLLMFGSPVERWLGARRYLFYYLVCVIGASLAFLFVASRMGGMVAPGVGASGGLYGLLLAFGMAFPKRKLIMVFPPMILPAWLLVLLYGIFQLVMGVTQAASGGAAFAHLGGMATGLVLILCWRARRRARRRTNSSS